MHIYTYIKYVYVAKRELKYNIKSPIYQKSFIYILYIPKFQFLSILILFWYLIKKNYYFGSNNGNWSLI